MMFGISFFLNYKSLLIINSLHKLNQKIIVTFQGPIFKLIEKYLMEID